MTEPQQVDGFYPRLNAQMLHAGGYMNMIVSVVGSIESPPDHQGVMTLRCADGGNVKIITGPDFGPPNSHSPVFEVIGVVVEGNLIQLFVVREFGDDFDMDNYNQMIQMQLDSRFKSEIFGHP